MLLERHSDLMLEPCNRLHILNLTIIFTTIYLRVKRRNVFFIHVLLDLFDPVFPVRLLNKANEGVQFQAVTKLQFSTKAMPGSTGVLNIPVMLAFIFCFASNAFFFFSL